MTKKETTTKKEKKPKVIRGLKYKGAQTFGRPREHDRDQIVQELIEWAKKDTSMNLNEFCCTREPPLSPCKITQWADEEPNFRKSYEAAKAFIGMRREKMLNENRLHVKAYDLNASTYDYFLRAERRAIAEHLASLQKDKEQTDELTPQQILSIKKVIDEN